VITSRSKDLRYERRIDERSGLPVGSVLDHDVRRPTGHRPKAGKATRPAGGVDARV